VDTFLPWHDFLNLYLNQKKILMKKKIILMTALVLSLSTFTYAGEKKEKVKYSYPAGRENIIENKNTLTNKEIEISVNRLNEIYAMDKSSLNSSEKKDLRKEVRTIKDQLRHQGGIYLSVGAIIIIVLLLILLL
jgi:hypothetical protein